MLGSLSTHSDNNAGAEAGRSSGTKYKLADSINLQAIHRTAGWSNDGTFAKYCDKPLDNGVSEMSLQPVLNII
ncbi:hypothetical protein DPMN_082830 [Dreissena polymorpha]|uniref:Uncharacterized protein n=1 Tax=Dreissena polymorpha TaxID=45954 RepID=A0A9D3Y7P1_DREPO|nr:hypothetical protein DPMN_082830 [Dreissena polymorpha]